MTKKEILKKLEEMDEIAKNVMAYYPGGSEESALENSDALTKLDDKVHKLYLQLKREVEEEE